MHILTSAQYTAVLLQHNAVLAARRYSVHTVRKNLQKIDRLYAFRRINAELTKRVDTGGPHSAIML